MSTKFWMPPPGKFPKIRLIASGKVYGAQEWHELAQKFSSATVEQLPLHERRAYDESYVLPSTTMLGFEDFLNWASKDVKDFCRSIFPEKLIEHLVFFVTYYGRGASALMTVEIPNDFETTRLAFMNAVRVGRERYRIWDWQKQHKHTVRQPWFPTAFSFEPKNNATGLFLSEIDYVPETRMVIGVYKQSLIDEKRGQVLLEKGLELPQREFALPTDPEEIKPFLTWEIVEAEQALG